MISSGRSVPEVIGQPANSMPAVRSRDGPKNEPELHYPASLSARKELLRASTKVWKLYVKHQPPVKDSKAADSSNDASKDMLRYNFSPNFRLQ